MYPLDEDENENEPPVEERKVEREKLKNPYNK
jgi:hypothetical protein